MVLGMEFPYSCFWCCGHSARFEGVAIVNGRCALSGVQGNCFKDMCLIHLHLLCQRPSWCRLVIVWKGFLNLRNLCALTNILFSGNLVNYKYYSQLR